jgi:putative hemolysin
MPPSVHDALISALARRPAFSDRAADSGGDGTSFGSSEVAIIVGLVVILFLLVFLAIAETTVSRVSRTKAEALAEEEGKRGNALLSLVSDPGNALNPILLCVYALGTGQAFLTTILIDRLNLGVAGFLAGFVVNVVIFFVLSDSLPKTWAVLYTERAALAVARPTQLLVRFSLLRWVSRALIGLTNWIFPGKGLAQGPFVSEREFLGIVEAAAQDEVIEHEERELIESVIEFGDTVAREVMVPRTDMITLDADMTVTEAVDQLVQSGHSRAPVVGEKIDDVLGVAYVRDLFSAERGDAGAMAVREFVRDASFFPETKPVRALMREMQKGRFHLAMLLDEYGGVAGLVTLEDLIEELIGDIVDEYDVESDEVEQLEGGALRVAAGLDVDELSELLDTQLPNTDWDTVGGLVFGLLGKIAEPGDVVQHDRWRFVVEEAEARRIVTVRVEPVPMPVDTDEMADDEPVV